MAATPVVCCVKWGTKYPSHYVNRLRNMVRRHLSYPHDFVCLTDDPAGLDRGIGTLPLPKGYAGFWNKVSLFRRGLFEHDRLLLYLDVDLVVVGPLDFLLEGQADLTVIGSFGGGDGINSSVMRIRAGSLPQVYDHFEEDAEAIVASGRYPGDQDWIHAQVPNAALFPPNKIVSYKKDMNSHVLLLTKKLGLDFPWIRAPYWMSVSPPEDASIVVFHGKPDPEDVMDRPYGPWKRAPFVKEHWH